MASLVEILLTFHTPWAVREQSKALAAEQRKVYQEKQVQKKTKADAKAEAERLAREEQLAQQRAAEEAAREEVIGRAHRMAYLEETARVRSLPRLSKAFNSLTLTLPNHTQARGRGGCPQKGARQAPAPSCSRRP